MKKSFLVIYLMLVALGFSACDKQEELMPGSDIVLDFPAQDMSEGYTVSKGAMVSFTFEGFGTEDGASIYQQPEHFKVSEVSRSTEDTRNMVYTYQPEDGFTGEDEVILSFYRGDHGDGSSGTETFMTIELEVK